MQITQEQRRERAQKAAATRRARQDQQKARDAAARSDIPAALALCRRVRDDEAAATADRLRAVELLEHLKKLQNIDECERK